jgi:peptide methionine sulfoxide reductase MsrB
MTATTINDSANDVRLWRGDGVPAWRRVAFRGFGLGGMLLLAGMLFLAVSSAGRSVAPRSSSSSSQLVDAAATAQKQAPAFGFCPAQPSVISAPLRWGSNPQTADHICCDNHDYAEYFGYWRSTSFPRELPAGQSTITFYDVVSGLPLFRAPVGRSWQDFYEESTHHGWPSFRDEETIFENVRVLPGGETVSVNKTHLGHNLPDAKGNRYCINIVCVAGRSRPAPFGVRSRA